MILMNPLKPRRYYTYYEVYHSKILLCVHRINIRTLYGSQNKEKLFPCAALTDWFYKRDVICLQRSVN
jgi:hypothetical protein